MSESRNMQRSMKLLLSALLFTLAGFAWAHQESAVQAFSAGPPNSRTGAPGETTCAACHNAFALNSGPGMLKITGVPDTYEAGGEYIITISINQVNPPASVRYGFQVTAIDDRGRSAGLFGLTDTTATPGTQLRTALVNGNTRNYVAHTATGSATPTSMTEQREWSFRWAAPSSVVGRVTFYVAGNRANGAGTNQGDYIYTLSKSLTPAQPALTAISVSAATYNPATPLTPEGVVAVFGTQLATRTASAEDTDPNTPGIQLPTRLAGTSVRVRDAVGTERFAPLLFVSQTQVNYLIPVGTVPGVAVVSILDENFTVSGASIQIAGVGPGIFTFDSTGSGVANGYLIRQRGTVQTFESIAQLNGSVWSPLPIDLGPETDQLFLVLFGSGWRNRQTATSVTATIGSVAGEVLYAGPQGGFVGVDQVNIRIPRTVTSGNAEVELTVDGARSNRVLINFK
ncbi:MAG: choice-of-anchor V domain-containing protein [Blastocatellia bacterium]